MLILLKSFSFDLCNFKSFTLCLRSTVIHSTFCLFRFHRFPCSIHRFTNKKTFPFKLVHFFEYHFIASTSFLFSKYFPYNSMSCNKCVSICHCVMPFVLRIEFRTHQTINMFLANFTFIQLFRQSLYNSIKSLLV